MAIRLGMDFGLYRAIETGACVLRDEFVPRTVALLGSERVSYQKFTFALAATRALHNRYRGMQKGDISYIREVAEFEPELGAFLFALVPLAQKVPTGAGACIRAVEERGAHLRLVRYWESDPDMVSVKAFMSDERQNLLLG